MSFIFVSHAAPDKRSRVRPLVQALAIEGVSLWLDRPDSGPNDFQLSPEFVSRYQIQRLRLGQDWDDGITAALRDAAAVLVCLSKAAVDEGREVLRQEMWGAQLTNKAVTCIVDDLDLSTVPAQSGLLSLGKSQSLRVDSETIELAVAWLEEDASRTPDQLPKMYQSAWQDVRRLRDELHRTRDEVLLASAAPSSPGTRYRWPTPWDFAAFLADKREAFEGRGWLFSEIAQWQAASQPRALLIRADFGVGKSALMAELVHRNPGGSIAAWHFCQHDTDETLQPGAFVRSLAAQLAATVPGYKELVDADPAMQKRLDCALADPGSALEGAVLAPLARLPAPPGPRLLVFDALDEALDLNASGAGAAGQRRTTIISLLAAKAGRFPGWLRVLATSRPVPQVLTPLHVFGVKEIDAESAGNQADLRQYILHRCAREPLAGVLRAQGHDADALAQWLAQRSQGKFLYTVRALRDLENGRIGVAELAALPPGMDNFYLEAFERRFARAGRDYEGARRVLGVLATAREPLPAAVVAAILGTSDAELKAVHKALPDFLRLRSGKLTFDHFSMAEWLTRDDDAGFARAGDYAIDAQASQAAMRRWALQQVADGVAHRSEYLLRHLLAHLESDDERRCICGGLMLERFEWLQARLDQAGPEALIADAQALSGLPGQPWLLALLRNSAVVLRQHPGQLAGQVLGRAGTDVDALRALAASALRWLADADPKRVGALLVPCSRSLRLSMAHQVTLIGGGRALAVLADGRIAAGSHYGTVTLWDPAHPTQPVVFKGDIEGRMSWVSALAVLPDGRIASGSWDSKVRLWNPARPDEPVVFEGHSDKIETLVVLPHGRIASGSSDGTVCLWDPARPTERVDFKGHSGGIKALVVLASGRIVSGSYDCTVRLWDPAHPTEQVTLEGHSAAVNALAVLPDGRIASGSDDGTVRLWDPAQPTERLVFEGRSCGVIALAVLSDWRIAAGCRDGTVILWDPARTAHQEVLKGHSGSVTALAALPRGRIASGYDDGTVCLWDPARPTQPVVFDGAAYAVNALAVLPDGRIVSGFGDNTVRLWDPACPIEPLKFEGHSKWVKAIAVLPDGRIASGSGDGTVRLWDPARPAERAVFEEHSSGVRAIAVLPDGRIASGSSDHKVCLWNPARPSERVVFEGHSDGIEALGVLTHGRIASGSWDGTVCLWDPALPTEWVDFKTQLGGLNSLVVLPDGRIASSFSNGAVCLWDPACPTVRVDFKGHSGGVNALVVLRCGLIASGSDDGTVCLWDPVRPTQPVAVMRATHSVTALAVLPDGRIALGLSDNSVWLLGDPAGKQPPRHFVADSAVLCLAVTKDGHIVAGCGDGGVHVLRQAP